MNSNLLKYIKSNSKFQGNEDLCEDFLAEALRRSVSITDSLNDIAFIEPYLKKVVNTSMLVVLKNSGRVRRVRKDYISMPPTMSLDELEENENESSFKLENVPDPRADFSEIVTNRELLTQVCNAVVAANETFPQKNYYDIFIKRYVNMKKQSDIAEELGISQSEVCKRLYELVKIIKNDVIGY